MRVELEKHATPSPSLESEWVEGGERLMDNDDDPFFLYPPDKEVPPPPPPPSLRFRLTTTSDSSFILNHSQFLSLMQFSWYRALFISEVLGPGSLCTFRPFLPLSPSTVLYSTPFSTASFNQPFTLCMSTLSTLSFSTPPFVFPDTTTATRSYRHHPFPLFHSSSSFVEDDDLFCLLPTTAAAANIRCYHDRNGTTTLFSFIGDAAIDHEGFYWMEKKKKKKKNQNKRISPPSSSNSNSNSNSNFELISTQMQMMFSFLFQKLLFSETSFSSPPHQFRFILFPHRPFRIFLMKK